jgi:hypothetical protein
VVDRHASCAEAEPGGFEGEGGGERHGVGAAGTGDEDERGLAGASGVAGFVTDDCLFTEDVVKCAANRQTYCSDRGVGTHVRFTSSRELSR